jgi:hypothetical protein
LGGACPEARFVSLIFTDAETELMYFSGGRIPEVLRGDIAAVRADIRRVGNIAVRPER